MTVWGILFLEQMVTFLDAQHRVSYKLRKFEVNSMNHCHGFLHIVEKGDTLYLLSRRYHVPLWAVLDANPYVNIYNLQIGDEICIPRRVRPRDGECFSCD